MVVGVNGKKFPALRQHMQKVIGDVYDGLDPSTIETWPADKEVKPEAYRDAAAAFKPGDCAIIFTPDDTHFDIAMACIERGMHVMITKPPVKKLEEHLKLVEAAKPKHQLETFKAWAGKSSDISYYLNSHHIDYH